MQPATGVSNVAILAYRRAPRPALRRGDSADVTPTSPLTRAASSVALLLAAGALAACHGGPTARARAAPPPATIAPLGSALPMATTPYRIDAGHSVVLILIYRVGRMAALGHNHVLAVHDLSGEVMLAADVARSSWQLAFPVAALSVDEPQLRAAEGADFQSQVDAAAIAGTRDHMLGPALLDAARFPTIQLQSLQLRARAAPDGGEQLLMTTRITVRDHGVEAELPVSLKRTADALVASGEFDLTHAQLGLTPYSVALGALRVAERMHVRYRLVAQRETRAAPAGSAPAAADAPP